MKSATYKADLFIKKYQDMVTEQMIPYQYEVMNDKIDGVNSHVIKNFENAAAVLSGEKEKGDFYGFVFQDSDLYKWLESVGYSLSNTPNVLLEQQADEIIELIGKCQTADGYLNTYFVLNGMEKRWTNLLEAHELYVAGHLFEAAVAYLEGTGKKHLLEIAKRNADHIYDVFITNGHDGYPGHPEIELALLKLYRATNEKKYLELARHFILVRGVDTKFYEREATARDWKVWGMNPGDLYYNQSFAPVLQQEKAQGHAVRAVYLYTAMADLAHETGDDALLDECRKLFFNITNERMYVTGGIGSSAQGEAFTRDFDLPNDSAYAESCASCGLVFFLSKMLKNELSGKYADALERAFFNNVIGGCALDGKSFYYSNPLEAIPGISGVTPARYHANVVRSGWHDCACCPPNIARTIENIGSFAYDTSENIAVCHLPLAGEICFENGLALKCETSYPFDFNVKFTVLEGASTFAFHVPYWCNAFEIKIDGANASSEIIDGYCFVKLSVGNVLEIAFSCKPVLVFSNPRVFADSFKACVQLGPLIYCAEGIDNDGDVLSLAIKKEGEIRPLPYDENLLSGIVPLEADGVRICKCDSLYFSGEPETEDVKIKLIPFFARENRGETQMRVFLPYI